jgi:ribonucleotide monophosphatase NagD (HAD superfamily)
VVIGKPEPALAEALAAVTGISTAETLFVGDRLSTDIAMGRRVGMITVLVLTGVTSAADLQRARAGAVTAEGAVEGPVELPDHVLPGLADLPRLLDSLGA